MTTTNKLCIYGCIAVITMMVVAGICLSNENAPTFIHIVGGIILLFLIPPTTCIFAIMLDQSSKRDCILKAVNQKQIPPAGTRTVKLFYSATFAFIAAMFLYLATAPTPDWEIEKRFACYLFAAITLATTVIIWRIPDIDF